MFSVFTAQVLKWRESDNCTCACVIGVKFQHICGLETRPLPTFLLVIRFFLDILTKYITSCMAQHLSWTHSSYFPSCLLVIFLTWPLNSWFFFTKSFSNFPVPRMYLGEVWLVCWNFKWSWSGFKQLLANQPDVMIQQSCKVEVQTGQNILMYVFYRKSICCEDQVFINPRRSGISWIGRLFPLLIWLGSQNFETNLY